MAPRGASTTGPKPPSVTCHRSASPVAVFGTLIVPTAVLAVTGGAPDSGADTDGPFKRNVPSPSFENQLYHFPSWSFTKYSVSQPVLVAFGRA